MVGCRPHGRKADVVERALRAAGHGVGRVNTGQHFDPALAVAGGSLGAASSRLSVLCRVLEPVLVDLDAVIVYGDTATTLAAALVACEGGVPVGHVEAGVRHGRRDRVEERNRVIVDAVARWRWCPSEAAAEALRREGITDGVIVTGDVLQEACQGRWTGGGPILVTLHRAENTDEPSRLSAWLTAINALPGQVVFPAHPRTRAQWGSWTPADHVAVVPPVDTETCWQLIAAAAVVVTDSGGVQREAAWIGAPCVVARDETEWAELGHPLATPDTLGACVAAARPVPKPRPPTRRPSQMIAESLS